MCRQCVSRVCVRARASARARIVIPAAWVVGIALHRSIAHRIVLYTHPASRLCVVGYLFFSVVCFLVVLVPSLDCVFAWLVLLLAQVHRGGRTTDDCVHRVVRANQHSVDAAPAPLCQDESGCRRRCTRTFCCLALAMNAPMNVLPHSAAATTVSSAVWLLVRRCARKHTHTHAHLSLIHI